MPTWRNRLSQRDSNQIASGVAGAVHKSFFCGFEVVDVKKQVGNRICFF